MLQSFVLRKLLASKLSHVPEAEREKILHFMERNPELLKALASELQSKVKAGKSEQEALQEVLAAHGDSLKKALQ